MRSRPAHSVRSPDLRGFVALCLLAIIAQITLPAIHNFDIHHQQLSEAAPHLCSQQTGRSSDHSGLSCSIAAFELPSPSSCHYATHRHDSHTCPICQAILLGHNLQTPIPSSGLLIQESTSGIVFEQEYLHIVFSFSFDCSPRSPPRLHA